MKKFFTIYFSLFLIIIITFLSIDPIKDYVKSINPKATWIIGGLSVIGVLINHWFTVYIPFHKYEKWGKSRYYVFEKESQEIIKKYAALGITVRLNIMVARFCLVHFIHPIKIKGKEFRKPCFFGKVFFVLWSNGEFGVNKKLKISTKQGVCGKAYETANAFIGAEFVHNPQTYNLNKKQLEMTNHLKMVASFRIRDEDDSPNKKSDNAIGVLNLESDTSSSENLIIDQAKKDELTAEMVAFSLFCSKFV